MISNCSKSTEETAEELYFGRLESATARTFQAHLQDCAKCRRINNGTVAMVEAMREAAKLFERAKAVKG